MPVTRVTHLFLTHLHYDHCVDYAYLTLLRWDQGHGQVDELAVHGPKPLAQMTQRLIGPDGAFAPDLTARVEHPGSQFIYEKRGGVLPRRRPEPVVCELASGDVVEGQGWRVVAAEARHVQPQLTSLAYRFESSGSAIVFTGDAASTPELVELARGANVLVHMCHYFSGFEADPRITSCCSGHLEAAQTAKQAGAKTLVLVHTTEQLDSPGVGERALREAGEVFDGDLIWGEDLLEVPLGEVLPGRIR